MDTMPRYCFNVCKQEKKTLKSLYKWTKNKAALTTIKWGAAQLKWVILRKQIYIYISMDICMDNILVHKCTSMILNRILAALLFIQTD